MLNDQDGLRGLLTTSHMLLRMLPFSFQFLMPMTPSRAAEDRSQETFAALETNHYAVKHLNKTFYMKRGEGPFGALGNKPTSLQQDQPGAASFLESQSSTDTIDLELGLAETSVPIMQMKDVRPISPSINSLYMHILVTVTNPLQPSWY